MKEANVPYVERRARPGERKWTCAVQWYIWPATRELKSVVRHAPAVYLWYKEHNGR